MQAVLPYSGWAFLGLLTDGEEQKRPPLPKISHIYLTMMKLGTFIPYLKRPYQTIYKSCDTPFENYDISRNTNRLHFNI